VPRIIPAVGLIGAPLRLAAMRRTSVPSLAIAASPTGPALTITTVSPVCTSSLRVPTS
jgi:hypothetical protein